MRTSRLCASVFLGSLLLEVAWIAAVPPFRNSDEFDHAYRAVSVAHGHWGASHEPAVSGRGHLVTVTPGIVKDATPECERLDYTGPDNCHPVERVGAEAVLVASGAARYNPVFYWFIGTAALPFDGAPALYVMRLTSALLCSSLLAAAAWTTTVWATSWWGPLSIAAAMTPVAVYSNSVAAPNGVEISAALGLWCSIVGLSRVDPGAARPLLVSACAFAVPLAGVRGLGPLWLACALAVGLLLVGRRGALSLISRHRRTTALAALTLSAVTVAASAWTLTSGSLVLEQQAAGPLPNAVVETTETVPMWFLQSIAAFPFRDAPAPAVVYAVGGLLLTSLIVAGVIRGGTRVRAAMAVTFFLALAIPLVLQVRAYPVAGDIWQGRYGWPLSMGVVVLSVAALDARPPRGRWLGPLLLVGVLGFVVAHSTSVTAVVLRELEASPLSGDSRWWVLPPWILAVMSSLGVLIWLSGSLASRPAPVNRGHGEALTAEPPGHQTIGI